MPEIINNQQSRGWTHWFFPLIFLMMAPAVLLAQAEKKAKKAHRETVSTKPVNELLQVFYPITDAAYSITICVDVPLNENPERVYYKGEPGHVFLTLTKTDQETGLAVSRSFGFYPRVPVSCLVSQVRSKILDNSSREYDAALRKQLTKDEFHLVLEKCRELSSKKYHLRKFNCYDYALAVFNSLPGIEKLPVSRVKFPFILGRGGSPCGLYRDLQILSRNGSDLSTMVSFGRFTSPRHNVDTQTVTFK